MKKVSKTQIAQNYAQALFEAAQEDNLTEQVFTECALICETFAKAPELEYLQNPSLKFGQKHELITQVARKLRLSKTLENFLVLTAKQNRLNALCEIICQFNRIYFAQKNILEIAVESAQPLTSAQQKKLTQGFENHFNQKTAVNYIINPDILGGLAVSFGSVRIDDTLTGKLKRLEQVMKGNL